MRRCRFQKGSKERYEYIMEIKKRPVAIGALIALGAWELILQPLWNLNVERLAESQKMDRALSGGAVMDWLYSIVSYVPSSFGVGFVTGALIFAYWDSLVPLILRRTPQSASKLSAWVGSISPSFDRETHKVSLFFRIINHGKVPFKIASVEGKAAIKSMDGSGNPVSYELSEVRFEHNPTTDYVEPGYLAGFSVALQAPSAFWRLTWDLFIWKPSPSLELSDLVVWIESEEGERSKLRLWESMRLSAGEDQIRSVETFSVWKDNEEQERFQKALSAVMRRFGPS